MPEQLQEFATAACPSFHHYCSSVCLRCNKQLHLKTMRIWTTHDNLFLPAITQAYIYIYQQGNRNHFSSSSHAYKSKVQAKQTRKHSIGQLLCPFSKQEETRNDGQCQLYTQQNLQNKKLASKSLIIIKLWLLKTNKHKGKLKFLTELHMRGSRCITNSQGSYKYFKRTNMVV